MPRRIVIDDRQNQSLMTAEIRPQHSKSRKGALQQFVLVQTISATPNRNNEVKQELSLD
jgi:hypothetical protein